MHYERAVAHLQPPTNGPVMLKVNVAWDTGEFFVKPEYFPDIEKVAEIMRRYPQVRALIKGYTDDRGSAEAKRRLSERRAEAVCGQLVDRFGIDPHRVAAEESSAPHPGASDPSAEDRRLYRRVEAVLSAPVPPAVTMADSD